MFATQNLFKSTPCPFFSQSTNTSNCERPFCPFKHQIQYEIVPNASNILQTTTKTAEDEKSNVVKPVANESQTTLAQLPDVLENISNALQTIQDLIKNSVTGGSTDSSSSQASTSKTNADGPNAELLSKLTNLSSAILKSVPNSQSKPTTTQAPSIELKKSSTSANLKRQQSAPDYNPTPIKELKKLKTQPKNEEETNEMCQSVSSDNETKFKRKNTDLQASKSEEILVHTEAEFEKPKKLKIEPVNSNTHNNITENNTTNKPIEKKCDILTFSKLSLSQQVLKRYELLNKPAPTTTQLNEAKLKKKTELISKATPGNKVDNTNNTPQLILDTSTNSTQKVPLPMRQRHLKVIFDNSRPLYNDVKLACTNASENEKSIYDRAKNKTIYTNLVAILIKNLRTQVNERQSQKNGLENVNSNNLSKVTSNTNYKYNKSNNATVAEPISFSHEMLLSGPKASRVSYSINRVKSIEIKDLSVTQLYQMFYSYILSDKQLLDNSFPRWMKIEENSTQPAKRLAFIPNFTSSTPSSTSLNKISSQAKEKGEKNAETTILKACKRCKTNFNLIDTSSTKKYSTSNSECVYHWGKLRSIRVNKAVEQRYSCCSGGINSDGCELGKHVYDGDYDGHGTGKNLINYVETQQADTTEKLLNAKTSGNIYALDCEMCYTTYGLELARVSIVDVQMRDVYEALIKPQAEVLDYNTRWSGLSEQTYVASNSAKTLKQVQSDLLRMFNKDTILIGHSLDSDFKALKLVHSCVVDTSVVFPHKMGPPYKRALRNLMSEHLQKIIQEDVDGHDSKEDATACIQLMLWKIEEDLKSKKSRSGVSNPSMVGSQYQHITSSAPKSNSIYKLNNLNTKVLDSQKPTQVATNSSTSLNKFVNEASTTLTKSTKLKHLGTEQKQKIQIQ